MYQKQHLNHEYSAVISFFEVVETASIASDNHLPLVKFTQEYYKQW